VTCPQWYPRAMLREMVAGGGGYLCTLQECLNQKDIRIYLRVEEFTNSEKVTKPGLQTFKLIVGILIISPATFLIYLLTGSQLHLQLDYSKPIQIARNFIDLWIMFPVGNAYQGFSLFGFFIPLVLMTFILTKKKQEWGIGVNKEYVAALLGTILITFTTFTIYPEGVKPTSSPFILIFPLSFYIGYRSKWSNPYTHSILLFTAFWLGEIPADIFGSLALLLMFGAPYSCVGGSGWGIGDGLWLISLYALAATLWGWYFWHKTHEDDVAEYESDTNHTEATIE
jgi:hypothetical protein